MPNSSVHQIEVTASPSFEEQRSDPTKNHYLFSYRIEITNNMGVDVKLLTRTWFISDAMWEDQTVMGDGVIGQQPVLAPGESFSYTSFCPLRSQHGRMEGFFTFEIFPDGNQFQVTVPAMELHYPIVLN